MTGKILLLAGGFALATALASTAHAKPPILVNCASGKTVQAGVNSAKSGDTIFIFGGTCDEDVTITTDDITLSGNRMGDACDKADPSASADATINGTVSVDGVRAKIELSLPCSTVATSLSSCPLEVESHCVTSCRRLL